METSKFTYKISDTNSGVFAEVNLPEGTFNLRLTSYRGLNNRREWKVNGHFPTEKYSITYEGGGRLFILAKGGSYEVGQIINHKAFGTGTIEAVNSGSVTINFETVGTKSFMTSILANFLTK